ncbi:tRNA (cytosine-5-)-methyltransferase [Podila minutissima]|uniref:tRNA (Cytosine-5-)-methyltransferase n=1 Tax=Podila minutissima TaxID=64525 RepID=A0A9P5VJP6_9FUNG|nr:tRNA (cytosine-5-)-methyltransferase [Podila minutissima]
MTEVHALEFFSGIGGLHHGFNASGISGQVLESFDMNQQANDTYKLSFGKNPPYTRGGKLLDLEDNRAKPLLHLLDQLEKMTKPPTYLFLENVKNFETSRSRERLVQLLHKMGYVFRECLLAPFNFGVPNDRLRYFLMARLRSTFEHGASNREAEAEDQSTTEVFDPEKEPIYTAWPFPAFVENPKNEVAQHPFTIPEISQFLDNDESQVKDYLLPRQLIMERPNFRFDVLRPSSNRSSCFTKAYGSHHVASGGGLLQTLNMDQTEYDFSNSEAIADLGLRFFTPTEVARLHVFPLEESRIIKGAQDLNTVDVVAKDTLTSVRSFQPHLVQSKGPFLKFPAKLKAIQRYKLLGNSLNVWVVAELLRGASDVDAGEEDHSKTHKHAIEAGQEEKSSSDQNVDEEREAKRPKQTLKTQ